MASRELIEAAEAVGLHVFGHPNPVLEITTPWEIIEDDRGFLNIHHPREDDGAFTGDLVATCFQDDRHAALLRAAPELLKALDSIDTYGSDTLSGCADGPNDAAWYRDAVREMRNRARKALSLSTGEG